MRKLLFVKFMKKFNNTGNIPAELVRWDLTGNKPEILEQFYEKINEHHVATILFA